MNIELLENKFSSKSVKSQFPCLLLTDTLSLLEQASLNNFAVVELMTYRPSKKDDYDYNDCFTSKHLNTKTDWDTYVKLNNEEILQYINKAKTNKKNKAFALEIIDYDEHLENLDNEKTYLAFLEILKKYQPNKNGLLEEISSVVTDKMLDDISKADYYDSEICYPILKEIRDTKTTPLKTEFVVGETLSLTQWGNPNTPEQHIERLFCNTTLLMLYPTDGISIGYNEIAPLATFIESVYTLDNKHHQAALSLITWRIIFEEENEYQDAIDSLINSTTNEFYIYTLILLLILNKKAQEDINLLVKMLIKIDENSRVNGLFVQNETFLLGLTNYDQRHNVWKTNTEKMLTQLDYITDATLKETLQKMGKAIIDDKSFSN